MKKYLEASIILAAGAIAWYGLSTVGARAGCIGAGLGDGCIGIPTPEHHEHVIVEHRHRTPMIVEHRHRSPAVFEHNYDNEDYGEE